MAVGYAFNREAVEDIRRDHMRLQREVINLQRTLAHDRNRHLVENIWVAKADAQIPARSGDTPGTGTCSIYEFDSSGMLVDRGFNETVYNLDDAVIEAAEYFPVIREFQGALWLAAHRYGTGEAPQTVMDVVRFELTASLAPGGTAAAVVLDCTSDTLSSGAAITVVDHYKSPGKFRGISGYRGVAFKRSDDTSCSNYTIIMMDELSMLVVATTTSTFSGSPRQASATVADEWQGVAPAGAITVEDRLGRYDNLPNGITVVACYDETDDVYVIVDAPHLTIVRFELTATLGLSGTAAAKVLACIVGNAQVDDAITVEDFNDNPGKFRGPSGYQGVAYWNEDSTCNYTIVQMDHKAIFVEATLTDPLAGGPPTSNAATRDDYYQGRDPGTPVTVFDRLGIYNCLLSGDKVLAAYDEQADQYQIVDADLRPDTFAVCINTGTNYTVEDADRIPCKIGVDKATSLHKVYETANADTVVFRIASPNDGASNTLDWCVLCCRLTVGPVDDDEPRWRNSLKLGRDVYAGLDATNDPGWLYAQGPNSGDVGSGIGISSLAANSASDPWHLWRMPKIQGNLLDGSHLVCSGYGLNTTPNPDELTVDWEYSKRGKSGTVTIDGETFTFEDGILVDSSDVTFTFRSHNDVTADRGNEKTHDFCP